MDLTPGPSSFNNGNSASVDLPIPTHAAGDFLFAWFECTGQAISTTPSGWSLAASTIRGNLYTRFDAAGTLSGTASWGLTAANRWSGGITPVPGVHPDIWDLGAPVITGDTTTTLILPGISPVTPGALLVTGFANSSPTSTGPVPTGWSQQYYVASSGVAAVATKPWPTPGATGDVTWTQSLSRACGGFLGALKPASSGGTTVTGSGALTLPKIAAAAAAVVALTGAAALGLPALHATGTGVAATTGQATLTLPPLGAGGNGTAQVAGSGAATLPLLQSSGTGVLLVSGSGASALPALTAHGTGAVGDSPVTGTAALTLPALQALGAGALATAGAGELGLPQVQAAGAGALATMGVAELDLPQLRASAVGDILVTGAGAVALPALTATATDATNSPSPPPEWPESTTLTPLPEALTLEPIPGELTMTGANAPLTMDGA